MEPLSERIAEAASRGEDAGVSAASYYSADSVVTEAPEWLSGEWAGESIPELLGDLFDDEDGEDDSGGVEAIEDAYETAASDAFWRVIDARGEVAP